MTKITLIEYSNEFFDEKNLTDSEAPAQYLPAKNNIWVNFDGITDQVKIEQICAIFNIHPLIIEDILSPDQRPKIEEFDDSILIIMKMLSFDPTTDEVITEHLSVLFGNNYVLSFQEDVEGDPFDTIRTRLRHNKGKLRSKGSDYLAYSLFDAIVDNYFIILEHIGDRIEILEDELLENPSTITIQKIHKLKNEMIGLKRTVWPLREIINSLKKTASPLVDDNTRIYISDLYDHTIQVIETVETYRDMISGMLDIYLSSISNKMNEVMKTLTIISTIFIPLTFIVGLYGMNFKYMPELSWKFGYPVVLLIMFTVAVYMVRKFIRKKWL
jgi:magnesium transporter